MAFIQAFVRLSCPVNAVHGLVAVPCTPPGLWSCWPCVPSQTPHGLSVLCCQMQDDKLQFLESIRSLCRSATNRGSLAGLECFCRRHELAEKVEVRAHLGSPSTL